MCLIILISVKALGWISAALLSRTAAGDRAYKGLGHKLTFKDVRAEIFYSIDFFKLLLRTDNDLLVSEMT